MLKSKVIRTIIDSCRDQAPGSAETRARAGNRSPAAGGGLAGPVPPAGAPRRRAALHDPRLGQSLGIRRLARRGSKRG
jgi:hypothetical protein